MSIGDNKAIVRRYFEDAPHNPSACDEIFAPRFQFHTIQHASITTQVVESSPEDEKAAYAWLKEDIRYVLDKFGFPKGELFFRSQLVPVDNVPRWIGPSTRIFIQGIVSICPCY